MTERSTDTRPVTPSPGVNIQDVEHDARPETRVDNSGIEVKPRTKRPEDPESPLEKESRFDADVARRPPD